MAANVLALFGVQPALLFCGDLNSAPSTAAMQYLLEGALSAAHPDWVVGANFRWGFASSRQAAKELMFSLNGAGPTRLLGGGLREKLERLKRLRSCWAALTQGGGGTDDEAAAKSQGSAGFQQVLRAELQRGETFQTSRTVAAAQLMVDAGLTFPASGRLPLDPQTMDAASAAIESLRLAVDTEMEWAMEVQAEAAQIAVPAAEGEGAPRGLQASLRGVGLELKHPFRFASAYEETPEFTNFIGGYAETLDWILFDQNTLQRVASAPLPSREVLEKEVALPSRRFPSDHILLAADLAWRD